MKEVLHRKTIKFNKNHNNFQHEESSKSKLPLNNLLLCLNKGCDILDSFLESLRPYIPTIGRAFIVATFYEDSFRIIAQWKSQIMYLKSYLNIYTFLVSIYLFVNIVIMIVSSSMIILKKKSLFAVSSLIFSVLIQSIVYRMFFNLHYFIRNMSIMGSLLIAYADLIVRDKRLSNMPGIPMINNTDKKKYCILIGRTLLILLFAFFFLFSNYKKSVIFVSIAGFICSTMIIVGYKTKISAFLLAIVLLIFNLFNNQFWNHPINDYEFDYLKYEFFQILSIVGGLLLILNVGPGEFSIDQMKKTF